MKVQVVVGFVDKNQFTRVKGAMAVFDDAYATELIEQGKVEPADQPVVDEPKASKPSGKRKASKRNARKSI